MAYVNSHVTGTMHPARDTVKLNTAGIRAGITPIEVIANTSIAIAFCGHEQFIIKPEMQLPRNRNTMVGGPFIPQLLIQEMGQMKYRTRESNYQIKYYIK